ncbi:RNA-binding protein 12B-like [Hyperolius riggenbachi]|uniref:RNA-binding protein 12B-like n=1 Tax=Hyperolius riggenbachi TaxID=752182 RepID=UPI0035A2F386
MSEIVRLQGLPPIADSFDIRQFFYGLTIPRGGVYITGGKYGEAFIIFSSTEDARYAMTLSGRPLKSSFIYLSYSTEVEMKRALEVYRIGLSDPLGVLRSAGPQGRSSENPSYLFVQGMPQKATKVELRSFFSGFRVDDVVFLKFVTGVRNGNAIIKFSRPTEAAEALKLDGVFLCGAPVTLRLSDAQEWNDNGGDSRVNRRGRSPPRRRRSRTRSRSPIRRRERHGSPYIREFYVHLINVSYRAEKKDLKKFFFDLDMDDSHITFLLDKDGKRTREAFAMFTTQKDYKRALSLNLESFKGHTVNILPISKKNMSELIERMKKRVSKDPARKSPLTRRAQSKSCLFLRNFASDVTKSDIVSFFGDFPVKDDDITILVDNEGVGLGEALVKCFNESEARRAEKLNHKKFNGTEILMSRISRDQLRSLKKSSTENTAESSLVSQADEVPESGEASEKPENVSTTGQELDKTKEAANTDDTNNNKETEAASTVTDDKKEPEAANTDVTNHQKETETANTDDADNKKEQEAANTDDADNKKEQEATNAEGTDNKKEADVTPPIDMDVTPPLETEQSGPPSDSAEPLPMDDSTSNVLQDSTPTSEADTSGHHKDSSDDMTVVFIRNLPVTITVAEILDFFHGYKVKSVNLRDISNGVATVRMPENTEAMSAIEALNEKEIGLKQVLLSLE